MQRSFLGKLIERMEHLGPGELQGYLIRLAGEIDFMETVLQTLQEGVIVLDAKGHIEYVNAAAHRLLPLPADLPDHAPISRYLRDLDWSGLLESRQGAHRQLQIHYPEARLLECTLLPLTLQDPPPASGPSHVAIFHDITKTASATRETIESERLHTLTLLAAGVAHELGNPLNNLNIHLQLLDRECRRSGAPAKSRLLDSLEILQEEVSRLDSIINEFLRAVRPTTPQLTEQPVRPVVEETLRLLDREIKNHNLLVEQDWPGTLPPVRLDAAQFKQVVYNIVKNALQAVPHRGVLAIAARQEPDWVVLEFRDNGGGIEVEDLSRVLQPYFSTKERGSGLGLMIVQRIIREHGGLLEIESRKGHGTLIRLRLPLAAPQARLLPLPEFSAASPASPAP